jgi:hypothetical protein
MKIKLLVVISLMVVMSAAMVAPVMAAETGTSTITGNPGAAIDITVTGSISNWALVAGVTNTNSAAVKLITSSNKVGWTVSVKDALDGSKDSGTAGKMANWTGSVYESDSLAASLHVTGETVSGKTTGGVERTLSDSDQTIETGLAEVSSQSMDITIGQNVAYTDPILPSPNVYRIIVTFTGSVA